MSDVNNPKKEYTSSFTYHSTLGAGSPPSIHSKVTPEPTVVASLFMYCSNDGPEPE